jgi:hypothetical protein
MPAPPIGGVGDAIGTGWAIGGEEAREGSGDGEATGVGPEDNAGGGVTEGAGVGDCTASVGETFGGELWGFAAGGGGCCGLAGNSDPGGGRGGPLDGPAEGGSAADCGELAALGFGSLKGDLVTSNCGVGPPGGLTGIPGLAGSFKDGRGGGFCSAINYLLNLVYA